MDDQPDDIEARLEMLRARHQELHAAIEALEQGQFINQLELRRLKKQKLQVKDEIVRLEDLLIPDIIA